MLIDTLKHMKKHKSCAEDGLVAEMLQTGSEELVDAMTAVFPDLLDGSAGSPEIWRTTKW
jgi:hypothetical protein